MSLLWAAIMVSAGPLVSGSWSLEASTGTHLQTLAFTVSCLAHSSDGCTWKSLSRSEPPFLCGVDHLYYQFCHSSCLPPPS